MLNRVEFRVTAYRQGMEGEEWIVQAGVEGEEAMIAVFPTQKAADTFAAAMNNAMDLSDGHPRRPA